MLLTTLDFCERVMRHKTRAFFRYNVIRVYMLSYADARNDDIFEMMTYFTT